MVVEDTVTDNGDASLNVTGGVPPYTYLWLDTNETTSSVQGLSSGPHDVNVYDAYGCMVTKSVVVINPGKYYMLNACIPV